MKSNRILLHQFRRLVVVLLALIGVQTNTYGVSEKVLSSMSNVDNYVLWSSYVYVVNDNQVTISASTGCNALMVNPYSTTTIYIPKGKTLNVYGGNSYDFSAAGAGIYVPANATLIIAGEGTLNVKGGSAGYGGQGGDGGNGDIDVGGDRGTGGYGGYGGFGGGGAGAAIGGCGGEGHDRLYGPDGNYRNCNKDTYNYAGNAGYASQKGCNGADMGQVFVLGSVTINATGGSASTVSGAAGSSYGGNDNDSGSGWYRDYTGGGGAPGGGGGSGYGVKQAIGGGAPGAQCGATGASGGNHVEYGNYRYTIGFPGAGGKGHVDGRRASDNNGSRNYNGAAGGSQSGEVASWGNDGSIYALTQTKIAGRTAGTLLLSNVPSYMHVTLKFDTQTTTGTTINDLDVVYGAPLPKADIPTRVSMHFMGYYTKKVGGEQVYDSNGQGVCYPTFTTTTTLYAQWSEACAQNLTTGEMCTTTVQDAINKASAGQRLILFTGSSEDLTIPSPILVDLNGNVFGNIYVTYSKEGTTNLANGKVNTIATAEQRGTYAKCKVELDNVTADYVYADGHDVVINSGTYGHVCNQTTSGEAEWLRTVSIKGEHTFVGAINDEEDLDCGEVTLMGGYYPANMVSEEKLISIPANYTMQAETAPTDAPSYNYIYKVSMRSDFVNFVNLEKTQTRTGLKATENTTVTCVFRIDSLYSGPNPIFGTSEAKTVEDTHKGFGVLVDGDNGSFIYAAGTEFQSSPEKMAKVGKTYYVTLSNGSIRIDTMANATSDYYHHDIAMYKFRPNNVQMLIGSVGYDIVPRQNISLFEFTVWEGEEMVQHLQPAYGYEQDESSTDIGLYDDVTGKVFYTVWNHPYEGRIGLCDTHPGYRIRGNGSGARRTCVICGQNEDIDNFVESNDYVVATEANGTDLVSILNGKRTNSTTYRIHYAETQAPYREFTKTVKTLPALKGMKLFSIDVMEKGVQTSHIIPTTSCEHYFLQDTISNVYYNVGNTCTTNYNLVTDHKFETTDMSDNVTISSCPACGRNSGIDLNRELCIETLSGTTADMTIRLRFKAGSNLRMTKC